MSQTTVRARYQVIARIASGGMGEVFRARDSVLDREVAIKVLHRNLAGDPGFIDRFRLEARAAALLSHPNIVAVHDWGSTTNGTYFMVMEFVPGHSLRDLLATQGKLEPQQAVEVLLQMLAALDHAHRKGIVHRDVKPENVLVTPDGVVKVADFGLARAFAEARVSQAPGTVTGTVQYLAPEQIEGDPADPRTDLYALGIVAYELLTGEVPFHGETSVAIAYKHLSDPVPPPSKANPEVPPELDRIVLRSTAKEREDRPASAAELRKDLIRVAGTLSPATESLAELSGRVPSQAGVVAQGRAATVTIPQTVSPKARRRRRRNRLLVALLAFAFLAGSGWAGWAFVVPHYTHVPSLVGVGDAIAQQRLDAAGLDAHFGPPVPSTKIPQGEVASQSPDPGTKVRKGTDVVLHLSAGLPLREVPDVIGDTLEQARSAIERGDLQVRVVRAFDPDIPEGRVAGQNPDSSQSILFGSFVTVTVSRGPQPVRVPNVVNQPAGDAEQALIAAQFTVQTRHEFSTTVPEGRVTRQQPDAGTADFGSRVILWVSDGPRTFPMPSEVSKSTAEAKSDLERLGLVVHVVKIPGSTGSTVVSQQPLAGADVQEGDTATIYAAF
jgi:eukaryotic-like serine/threonine-protein kinase